MIRLRRLLAAPADAGMSIVEVVVALFVFAVMSTGVAAGTMSITRITGDSRAREIATQLAAQDMDAIRAIGDPFDPEVKAKTWTKVVSGRTFTIERETFWVNVNGVDTTCGNTDNFRYRRVTATVTWDGQLTTTSPVMTSTVLAPLTQLTDAASGAISIRVIGADGLPRSGVTAKITPVSGGQALSSQPDPTDSEGCAYAATVIAGTYKIVLSKTDYIDTLQVVQPTMATAVVAAGTTYAWTVQYDKQGVFTTAYAKNFSGGTPKLPIDLDTTFAPNLTGFKLSTTDSAASSVNLHPFPSGYTAVAGLYATPDRATTCASTDPAAWPAGQVSGQSMAQGVRAAATATAGNTATFRTAGNASIPMGVVKVSPPSSPNLAGFTITARSATPAGEGNPGCTIPLTYTFSPLTSNASSYYALPFGSWNLYASSGTTVYPVTKDYVSVETNNDANGITNSGGITTVTLDPRIRS